MKNLLLLVGLFFSLDLTGQTFLAGKIVNRDGNLMRWGFYVKLYQGNEVVQRVKVDADGEYFFLLEEGEYDLEICLLGSPEKRINDVQVLAGKANIQNAKLQNFGKGCLVQWVTTEVFYFKDETWSGQFFNSRQLQNWFR